MQPDSFSPLYFRIEQELIREITRLNLRPGDRLPSEAEIAGRFGVSRITARRALTELVQQGFAYSQQGRGTFVAQRRIREISGFHSFSEDMVKRGLRPSSSVVLFEEQNPPAEVREKLNLKPEERVYCLKRIRLANNAPVAYETAYLPVQLCPGLIDEDLSGQSLYAVLRSRYGVYPTWADAEIEAGITDSEELAALHLKPGMAVLRANRLTYSRQYTLVEMVRSVYRGDRFTFFTGRQFIG